MSTIQSRRSVPQWPELCGWALHVDQALAPDCDAPTDGSVGTLPLVSVVIPTSGLAPWLGESVETALEQSYPNVEVLVVDDGCNSDAADVLHAVACRCRTIRLPDAPRGTGAARNAGWRAARGDWIALLDHDDLWFPWKLARQVEAALARPGVRACYCSAVTPVAIGSTSLRRIDAERPLFDGSMSFDAFGGERAGIWLSTLMLRRDLLEEVGGFDERYWGVDDCALFLEMAARNEPLCALPAPMVYLRAHTDQTSRRLERLLPEAYRLLWDFCERRGVSPTISRAAEDIARQLARVAAARDDRRGALRWYGLAGDAGQWPRRDRAARALARVPVPLLLPAAAAIAPALTALRRRLPRLQGVSRAVALGVTFGDLATHSGPVLFVAEDTSSRISALDCFTGRALGHIDLAGAPLSISADAARSRLYVLVGPSSMLMDLDLTAGRLVRRWRLGGGPYALTVCAASGRVAVSDESAGTVSVYGVPGRRCAVQVQVGNGPAGMAFVGGDGEGLLVTCKHTDELVCVDLERRQVFSSVRVGLGPRSVILASDDRTAFVLCDAVSRVAAVDIETHTVDYLDTGGRPLGITRQALGSLLVVTQSEPDSVLAIDTNDRSVRWRTPLPRALPSVAFVNEHLLLAACRQGAIAQLDSATGALLGNIKCGSVARAIAVVDLASRASARGP